MSQSQSNPWKITTIALVASVASALATSVFVAGARETDRNDTQPEIAVEAEPGPAVRPEVQEAPAAPVAKAAAPERSLENCERYRYKTRTDGGRVVKNGLIGGALGAGLGAAGGAIGGSAGKGAGIGAAAGAVIGTGYTLHDEHKQKQASRDAYHACLARNRS
ncbi:MAG: hypothetical protein QNK04_30405 [Myxococcota bacterium]|nr:hypothetical protein [Myxococcota bacterium]